MTTPFLATYYVDPSFVGTSTGSADSPFPTIALAFAAAIALGLGGALIKLPPLAVVTEDVTFPDGNWEIECEQSSRLATIDGTVNCSPIVAGSQYRLTNLTVNHAITGTATNVSAFCILKNTRAQSTVTLGGVGTGGWFFVCVGDSGTNFNALSGFVKGNLNVTGSVQAHLYEFLGDVTYTVTPALFDTCRFQDMNMFANAAASGIGVQMFDCTFVFPFTITGAGGPVKVLMDGPTLTSALTLGLTLAGTATHKTSNGGASSLTTISTNIAPITLAQRAPAGLYSGHVDMQLLLAAGAGNATANVIYTNMAGVLTTTPVASLDVSGASGNEASAVKPFQHNGATDIKYSVTGISTPGASIALAVDVQKTN